LQTLEAEAQRLLERVHEEVQEGKIDPYQVVRDFEKGLCEYTGSPYAVTTNSCTMALLLSVAYHAKDYELGNGQTGLSVEIPKKTYISVPMSILHARAWPVFRDEAHDRN